MPKPRYCNTAIQKACNTIYAAPLLNWCRDAQARQKSANEAANAKERARALEEENTRLASEAAGAHKALDKAVKELGGVQRAMEDQASELTKTRLRVAGAHASAEARARQADRGAALVSELQGRLAAAEAEVGELERSRTALRERFEAEARDSLEMRELFYEVSSALNLPSSPLDFTLNGLSLPPLFRSSRGRRASPRWRRSGARSWGCSGRWWRSET